MPQHTLRYRLAVVAMTATTLASCDDAPPQHPTGPDLAAALTAAQPELTDVPRLVVDLPSRLRPWDTSDVALAEEVARQDGVVAIGFKDRGAARTIQTGVREALTAVTFTSGLKAVQELGGELLYVRKHLGSVHARIPSEVAAELRGHALVDYVEPRLWGELAGTPTRATAVALAVMQGCDPYTQECLTWGVNWVNARDAHLQGSAGFGGRVLIIDTGHERGHTDLPLVWLSHCGGPYNGCADHSSGTGRSHGTHVTGTLVARDNTGGIVGTAPLVAASRVYVWGACDIEGHCSFTDVADGLDAAITWDVQVVNMSLGDRADAPGYLDLAAGVAAANAANILLVAAAGNIQADPITGEYLQQPGTVVYPAAYNGVIGVSGIIPDSTFAAHGHNGPTRDWCSGPPPFFPNENPGSNYGSHVDLTSAFFALSTVVYNGYEDYDAGWCGTSMATPHVSGVATLIRAKYPALCASQVAQIMFSTAVDLGAPGRDDYYGYGLPDAVAALDLASVTTPCSPPPPPVDVSIEGPTQIRPEEICSWEAVVEPPGGGYTYNWYNDGIWGGTGRYYMGGKDPGSFSDHFTLRVDVSGAGVGSATTTVYENSSAPICFQ
ncbi:MAG TPA: S8 family serine peptidase [Gemmatimonadales bacterium]